MMPKQVEQVNERGGVGGVEVLERLHTVMHLYRAQQFRALREGADAVTHMESRVLGYFARHPGATPSELVAHSGRDKGQITRLVQGLRERGLIEARPDEVDRRSVRLHLSADGIAATRAVQAQTQGAAAAAVDGLSNDERQSLVALLGRLEANLVAAQETGGSGR